MINLDLTLELFGRGKVYITSRLLEAPLSHFFNFLRKSHSFSSVLSMGLCMLRNMHIYHFNWLLNVFSMLRLLLGTDIHLMHYRCKSQFKQKHQVQSFQRGRLPGNLRLPYQVLRFQVSVRSTANTFFWLHFFKKTPVWGCPK